MKLNFITKNSAPCLTFFKIIHDNKEFLPNEFASFIQENNLDKNEILSKSIIFYRGYRASYSNYINHLKKRINEIKQSTIYINEFSNDILYFFQIQKNLNYTFFEKIEDALSNARMYINMCMDILPSNYEQPYVVTYTKRCLDFSNACMSIYSCYEYMLILVHFYYNYEGVFDNPRSFENVLKSIRDKDINIVLNTEPIDDKKREFMKILSNLKSNTSEIRNWVNAIKHRCGIEFYGLKPQHPFKVQVEKNNRMIDITSIIKLPIVDIDENLKDLIRAYNETYNAIAKISEILKR